MDVLTFLYQLLIMPLQIVFEGIYYLAFKLTGNLGVSIVALSFVVSLLVVPLYNRAEVIQKEEREIEAKLAKGVEHIKKTFRGDEQLMMLQTYYRKNNYSPLYFLRGSLSLLLQIPFFIAAYQFLSNLELLQGVSFGFIKDLALPDGLLNIAGITINVLPIIMTLVNLISTYLFAKDFPLKTKIQLNGMAFFFLVFLYNSPAGLLCYWTCNNIFNLIKVLLVRYNRLPKMSWLNKVDCFCQFSEPNKIVFIYSTVFLAILTGAVIPSAVIESSPQEFVIIGCFSNPMLYLVSSTAIAIGTFVVWLGIFYWIANPKYKVLMECLVWTLCGLALVNYMFFGKDLGLLTSTLQYENGVKFSKIEKIINTSAILIILCSMNFVWKRYKNIVNDSLIVGIFAMIGMIGLNMLSIQRSVDEISDNPSGYKKENRIFELSKNGKNIIVFMLDRAMGSYVPYIFNEKPILKEQFSGFTYYENTISFGGFTNFGTPSLFGGYEYTPIEMNKRKNESLMTKHNEALKVMPVLFDANNFNVIVCNPSYANYQWIPDISIYNEFPGINKYLTIGKYGIRNEDSVENMDYQTVKINNRNFFMFGIMKSSPLIVQNRIYNSGRYGVIDKDSQNQVMTSLYTAKYTSKNFLKPYNVLKHLPDMTKIIDTGNTFIMMTNDITHEPCLLQAPEYVPALNVDNTEYEKNNSNRFVVNKRKLKMANENQVIHYHANMAALIQLGKWFDYMRKNNVYDNSRIIVVADHGRPLQQLEELILDDGSDGLNNVEFYFPLLLVKDFDAKGFNVSNEFMTNADVATIATNKIINNPINPFTGNQINNLSKVKQKQYVLASYDWNVNKNNGSTYLPGRWYSVHTNIWDKTNWKIVKEKDVMPY